MNEGQGTNSLSKWFSERPHWLQAAANKLLKHSELSEEDIAELANLCRHEAEGKISKVTSAFPANAFTQSAGVKLRLCSIGDIEGVNALAPKSPIEFGKGDITIVYGNNGSGKSGYVRLLKHICGARERGNLHGNVYKAGALAQKARIEYEQDGISKTHEWSGQGICDDLTSVDIFDTSFGKVFVNSEDEVSYEPPVLSFFSDLIHAAEKVSLVLEAEATRYQSKKPNIPGDKKETPEGIWYEAISSSTTVEDIERYCVFSDADEAEMQALQKRLAEKAPADKARQLRKQIQHLESLVQDTQKHIAQLSAENVGRIIAAKRAMVSKKEAADISAKKAFSGSELHGIGSDVWKQLWEAARNYSTTAAYPEAAYPNVVEGSFCVLCHQPLDPAARSRLTSFEEYVQGEMLKAAVAAKQVYETASQTIEELPTKEALKTRMDAAGITQEEIAKQVTEFYDQLQTRRKLLPGIDAEASIPDTLPPPKWFETVRDESKRLGGLAEKYDEDAKSDNRDANLNRYNGLQAKKWLLEQRAAIDEEVTRLRLVQQIQDAKKLTNTRALSQKKGELADVLITDAFVQRFNDELNVLGASQVKVELVKTKVTKGRVLHKLQLRGASQDGLADVLSEGESRIVSIAAFLADVCGKSNQAPFVFDDPISSLDQSYEEAVVQRLIELSQDKQVIVFTHRLSLLGTIRHFADNTPLRLNVLSIRSVEWGTGEPAPIPISQSDIKAALNILMNQRIQDVKRNGENGEYEIAEILMKSICSDFRILLERSIENDLLCGVVQRYQRPVKSLKLKELGRLQVKDCDFLDGLMTKYSAFEHSQPDESPVELPNSDELLADMTALKTWREEYAKRPVTRMPV